MKKIFKTFALAAVAAISFAACNKETEVATPAQQDQVFTFAISENSGATKSILGSDENGRFVQFDDDDNVNNSGLGCIAPNAHGYSKITPASGNTPITFSIYTKGVKVGNTITVWYPYRSTQADATDVELVIPAEQTHKSDNAFDMKAMPMVTKQIVVDADMVAATSNNYTPVATINFANMGSLLNFKVFSTNDLYAGEKVKSITFNAKNEAGTADANIGGTFTKNLATIDPDDESTMAIGSFTSGVSSIVTTPYADAAIGTSKAKALDLYMVVAPGTYKGTIVVKTDAADYTYTITNAATLSRSGIKAYGLDLGSATAQRDNKKSYTITQSDVPFSGSGYSDYENVGIDEIDAKFTFKQIMKSGNNFQLKASSGSIANTTAIGAKIHSIVFSTVTNSVNVTAGSTADALSAEKVTVSGDTYTFDDGCKFFKIATSSSYAVIGNITVYYYPANWVLNSIEVTKEPGKKDYEAGENFDATGMEVTAHYVDADDNTNTKDVILDNNDLEITPSADLTEGTTSVTITYGGKTTTQNITVTAPTLKKVDILTYSWTGVSGSGYKAFSNISGSSSDAVYAGQVNAGVNYIQLRNQNPSGIVTTQSGGILKSISITWNSSTGNDRSLSVYAKNTAYTESADLYDANKKGTLVHTFTKSAGDASWTFTDDYKYVGLLASGALYIDEIDITWIPVTWTLSSIEVTNEPDKTAYEAGEDFDATGMEVTAHYVDAADNTHTKDVVLDNGDLTISPSTSLTAGTTSVTITYGGQSTTQAITVSAAKFWDLKSIAVKTAPTKTTYTEGEYFDPTGLVITPTYENHANTAETKTGDDVAYSNAIAASFTFAPTTTTALQTSNTSISISYTEGGITKSTTQTITVNEDQGTSWHAETWSKLGTTGTSYTSGSVDGDLGTWSYAGACLGQTERTSFTNQRAIIMGSTGDSAKLTSPTFDNGINGIKFNYWVNNAARKFKITVYEDGDVVKTETVTPTSASTIIPYEVTVSTTGSTYFTVEPTTASRRVSVGDFQVNY